MAEKPLVDVRARRAARAKPILVALDDGSVIKCKRLDMMAMLFNDLLPMPMLNAAQKLTKVVDGGDPTDQSLTAIQQLTQEERTAVNSLMQRQACAAAIEPVVVMEDDGDETHLPVETLSFGELMAIWNATTVLPAVGPATASEFRRAPLADAPAVRPDGEDVRPAAEPVVEVETALHL